MAKSILVLDNVPTTCYECQLESSSDLVGIYCSATRKPICEKWETSHEEGRLDCCPLKGLPDKLSMDDYDEHVPEDCEKLLKYYNDGFNDCINRILGEEE